MTRTLLHSKRKRAVHSLLVFQADPWTAFLFFQTVHIGTYAWFVYDSLVVQKIRRKYIDKPGKVEKRPLGIPTIRDRIVQECIRIVLDPIMEAQFFAHSYGFRPMRDTAMALERIKFLTHSTGYGITPEDYRKGLPKLNTFYKPEVSMNYVLVDEGVPLVTGDIGRLLRQAEEAAPSTARPPFRGSLT